MKIRVYVSTNLVSSETYTDIELNDNSTEEEIETEAREAMFEMINWNYEKIE